MKIPGYKAGAIDYWLAEAGTQFVNGFIGGFKVGALGGGGGSIGLAASPVGEKISPVMNALFALGSILVICAAAGVGQFHDWHKTNPFPNPMPKPNDIPPPSANPPAAQ